MTLYAVRVYLNTESRFTPYQYGHALVTDERCTLLVEADSPADAMNKAWAIGNRNGRDKNGRAWSPDVRSVSVGDVICVNPLGNRHEQDYAAVETVGWRVLSGSQITNVKRGVHAMVEGGVARDVVSLAEDESEA